MIIVIILSSMLIKKNKHNQFKTNLITLFYLLGFSVLTGCTSIGNNQTETQVSENTKKTIDVTVSILPQEYFVKKIGGDRLNVNVMVGSGATEENYEPKPQQLKALSEAEAYISIGIPFEKIWLKKIEDINPNMLIIDSAKNIDKIKIVAHNHDHNNNEEKDKSNHSKEELDPHIWLSPKLVKIQAENIYQGLISVDPNNKTEYKKNLDQFLKEIDQLNEQIAKNLSKITNRKFIVFHPSWGYFAQDYKLKQIPVEINGVEPSAAQLGELIKTAKQENIKVIFAQPQFSTKTAETIAKEINGEVLLIDHLAVNWSSNLLQISDTFAKVL